MPAPREVEVDERSDGETVSLRVGDTVTVTLSENPTTGYRWIVRASAEGVCDVLQDVYRPTIGRVGAGGTHMWQLRAARSGAGRLDLACLRPWEAGRAPVSTFTLYLRVEE